MCDESYPFVPGDLIVARFTGDIVWARPHNLLRPEEDELVNLRKDDVLTVIATGHLDIDAAWRWYVVLHSQTLMYGWVRIRAAKTPRAFAKLAMN